MQGAPQGASRVRNAIARFDQLEGITDTGRTEAWKQIKAAARKNDIDIGADDWRNLFAGGKAQNKS
jgi:hypothetical protein